MLLLLCRIFPKIKYLLDSLRLAFQGKLNNMVKQQKISRSKTFVLNDFAFEFKACPSYLQETTKKSTLVGRVEAGIHKVLPSKLSSVGLYLTASKLSHQFCRPLKPFSYFWSQIIIITVKLRKAQALEMFWKCSLSYVKSHWG